MRLPPPTILMCCSTVDCIHATGVEVGYVPDSADGPGWPKRDSCPKCDSDLMYDPHPEPEEVES